MTRRILSGVGLLVPLFVAEDIHRQAPRSELRVVHALPVTRPAELAEWIVRGTRADS